MTFSLYTTLRQIHDETDLTDHRQVAEELRTRIPDDEAEGVLLTALTEYVRTRFVDFRRRGDNATEPEPTSDDESGHETPEPAIGQKPNTKSWMRDGIRQYWWQQKIHCRYDTADGQSLLRDFTAEDCGFQISLLREQIEAAEGKIEQWDELAKLLELNGAATVGDLPAT